MKKQNGITLIALIITIIVLVILAAVSINAAFNTGLTEYATNGAEKYKIAEEAERKTIDTASMTVTLTEFAIKNQEYGSKTDTEKAQTLKEYLEEEGYTVTNSNGTLTASKEGVTTKIDSKTLTVLDTGSKPKRNGATVTAADYGKTVSYTPEGGGTWRLFLKDGDTVYLLRDKDNNLKPTLGQAAKGTVASDVCIQYNSKWTSWTGDAGDKDNVRYAKWLTDQSASSNWNKYKIDGANWAIGAPAADLFIQSFNEAHEESNQIPTPDAGYKYDENGTYPYTWPITYTGETDNYKAIYGDGTYDKWWLCNPSGQGEFYIGCIKNTGLDYYNGSLSGVFLRPLVSLPWSMLQLKNGALVIESE